MPPTIPPPHLRHLQTLFGNSANGVAALKHQQNGGTSGTIPGTDSDPTVVGMRTGVIWVWPLASESPNGDQVAGVGHQAVVPYVDEDGILHDKPIVVMGNLAVTQATVAYTDRSMCLLDSDGNVLAWHSGTDGPQHTILTNPQSGNYTFTIHDVSKVVESTGSSAQTFTIPTQASSGIPLGSWIEICQVGSGALTIATAGGVTLLPSGATGPSGQGATIGLRQRQTADQWVMTGSFS